MICLRRCNKTFAAESSDRFVQIAIHIPCPSRFGNLLVENLEIKRSDVFIQKIPLGLADLMQVYESIERYDLNIRLINHEWLVHSRM